MNDRIREIRCLVRCGSAESLRAATETAERLKHPDTEIVRTVVTIPGGSEEKRFRIGDYFDKIEIEPPESGDVASFLLAVQIRECADSCWKGVLVAALQTISNSATGVQTSILQNTADLFAEASA